MSQSRILGHSLIMQALSKTELLALLAAARAYSERDFLMILMAYCHGLRASEVIAIRRHDIKDGCLGVRRLKGSKRTVQPLLEHENPLLNERLAAFEFIEKLHRNRKALSGVPADLRAHRRAPRRDRRNARPQAAIRTC